MTTVRLPPPPSVMPPLVVEPAQVHDCALHLQAACTRLDDLGSYAAGPARLGDWTGVASAAYHREVAAMGRGADAMSLALRRVARRVEDHGDVLTHLREQYDDLARVSVSLAGGIEMLRHDIAAATPDRIVALAPILQARSDAVAAHIAAYEAERERWVHDLAREEREMIAAFERVLTLESVERRFGGVADPADRALATLPAPGALPAHVRAWWRALGPAERAGLVVAAPGVIGNLDGLPALVRHRANRVRLERDLAGLRAKQDRGVLTSPERALLRNAEAAEGACDRVEGLVDPRTGRPVPVRLHLYDPTAFAGDGAVAISVGDLDTAADVSLLVPGLGSDGAAIGGVTDAAIALYEAARERDGSVEHASLAWIGYDAPDNVPLLQGLRGDALGVVGEGLAVGGGRHLGDLVDGLRAGRKGEPADLTAIGHSYGSTTVGQAAYDQDLAVDDIAVVGSPGLGGDVEHAADLGVGAGHVWAGANSRDAVAGMADNGFLGLNRLLGSGLGHDPAGADFGAIRFQAESIHRGLPGNPGDHLAYFDHDTESLRNLAAIVTGHHDDVRRAAPVHDPWWGRPIDPEFFREATAPTTTGDHAGQTEGR